MLTLSVFTKMDITHSDNGVYIVYRSSNRGHIQGKLNNLWVGPFKRSVYFLGSVELYEYLEVWYDRDTKHLEVAWNSGVQSGHYCVHILEGLLSELDFTVYCPDYSN